MARWSSGQDTGLSRRKRGFDSPTGHHYLENKICCQIERADEHPRFRKKESNPNHVHNMMVHTGFTW